MLSNRWKNKLHQKFAKFLLFWNAGKFLISGKFLDKQAHLPAAKFNVPADFFGLGVAPGPHPAYDDYICDALASLKLSIVRIDVSNDNKDAQMRLMDKLTQAGIKLIVHFVQHPDEAKIIAKKSQVQRQWAEFIRYILNRYQASIHMVEIGSTVNRPRWSGYTLQSFMSAWQIAHPIVKEFRLTLAGPNITDFEPPYTELFLRKLQKMQLLPDVYSNNLFAERATEPERYDHKVMGYRLADKLKFNLIKKANTLKQLSLSFGVNRLASLSSFWTLPRIQRYTIFTELKQADYLVRYMVLCVASGALEKAFWGPLICHREGLIDDHEEEYPQREKISYYEKVTGQLSKLTRRPSFHAMRFIISHLSEAEYLGSQSELTGLEIHRFKKQQHVFDIAWCINGLGYSTYQVYSSDALSRAQFFDIRGEPIANLPDFINEQPIMLQWNDIKDAYKPIAPKQALSVKICRYGYVDYFHLQNQQWQAVIASNLRSQAIQLFEFLISELDKQVSQTHILRKGRNVVWQIPHPFNPNIQLVLKRPARQHWYKRWLDKAKPNKSKAAWNASCELMRKDIAVAKPIAFIEHLSETGFNYNLYVCEAVKHQATAREMFAAFNLGQDQFLGLSKTRCLQQLSHFVNKMHHRGVMFRDLSAGNLLLDIQDDELMMTLIDTNRARFYLQPLTVRQRLIDLVRVCNKINWADREVFLAYYFASKGNRLQTWMRLSFYLYDLKVVLKRKLGRKAWRQLIRRFTAQVD